MTICKIPGSLLAYNPRDLVPYGFITSTLLEEFPPGTSEGALPELEENQTLRTITNENDEDVFVIITKQLPARSLQFNVVFTTTIKSGNTSIGELSGNVGGGATFGTGAGAIATTLANAIILGGVSFGKTRFAIQIIESTTVFDLPVTITKEAIDTGILTLDGFPLTILGVFDQELELTDEQKGIVGESTPVTGISGTGEKFRGNIVDELVEEGRFESYEVFEEADRFEDIVKDERLFRFRADTDQTETDVLATKYAFNYNNPENFVDATSDQIKIDVSALSEGDIVYLTATMAKNRTLRQLWEHRADIFEEAGAAFFNNSNITALGSLKVWNFQISPFKVPQDLAVSKVDPTIFQTEPEEPTWDDVEGWRISESAEIEDNIFGADSRGIVFFSRNIYLNTELSEVILPREQIRDQDWFNQFLEDNLELKVIGLDDLVKGDDISFSRGTMFDLSEHVNSLVTDQQKVPYERSFALALSSVSTFDPDDPTTGVGIPNLDLLNQNLGINNADAVGDLSTFDLSTANFISSGMPETDSTLYSSQTCQADRDFGSFRDPTGFGANFGFIAPVPAPDIQTDWNITTPLFFGSFGSTSRIYVERYAPDRSSKETKRFNFIFAKTRPLPQSSFMSLDIAPFKKTAFTFFGSENSNFLAYYKLDDGSLMDQVANVSLFTDGNNEQPDFDHNQFRFVGYNQAMGDTPSYSVGRFPSTEIQSICRADIDINDIYERKNFSISSSETPVSISLGSEFKLRDIEIEYEVNKTKLLERLGISTPKDGATDQDLKLFAQKMQGINTHISFYFPSTNQVINNVSIPIFADDAFGNTISRVFTIDAHFYGGTSMEVNGDILDSIVSIKNINTIQASAENIEPFLVKGSQNATAFDGRGKLYVFFSDEDTNNISVIVSEDLGRTWFRINDIIRLTGNEIADAPYVIVDKPRNSIQLFYRLNGTFLMQKHIDTTLFVCEDADVEYNPPDKFDAESDDDEALEGFSFEGRVMRKEPSYFVIADSEDKFFIEEIAVSQSRLNNDLVFRFVSASDSDAMDRNFDGGTYSVYKDKRGAYRVFWITEENEGFNVRFSSDAIIWTDDASIATMHKNFIDQDVDRDAVLVNNPQTIYDEIRDVLYLLYTHQGALFMRMISGASLLAENNQSVQGEGSGEFASENLREALETSVDSPPLFMIGILPPDILSAIENNDENLLVRVVYPEELQTQFNGSFAIDSTAKPVGYTARNGLVRFFYKNEAGLVYGLTFNALEATLDVQLRDSTIV